MKSAWSEPLGKRFDKAGFFVMTPLDRNRQPNYSSERHEMFFYFAKTVQGVSWRRPPITSRLVIITFAILLGSASPRADSVLHRFAVWGKVNELKKKFLYWGWTNGFLLGRGLNEFATCLNGMTIDQAVAMIDKAYKDHPEKWSYTFSEEVLAALTVDGGPCQGMAQRSESPE